MVQDMKQSSVCSLIVLLMIAIVSIGCTTSTKIARSSSEEIYAAKLHQNKLAIDLYLERLRRTNELAWPIMVSNEPLCNSNRTNGIGVAMITARVLPRPLWEIAHSEHAVTMRPQIAAVATGSPAELAGLREGDVVLSIDGRRTGTRVNAISDTHNSLRHSLKTGLPVKFEIERQRDGHAQHINVHPVPACSSFVYVVLDRNVNAFADGKDIFMLTGLIQFAQADEDLQLVIAHELAHNSHAHVRKSLGNVLFGSLADVFAASQGVATGGLFGDLGRLMYSREFEREADYVGMYMLARANVSTTTVANFWNRLAAEFPSSNRGTLIRSHPLSSERFANIQKAHNEISAKIQTGIPLFPES